MLRIETQEGRLLPCRILGGVMGDNEEPKIRMRLVVGRRDPALEMNRSFHQRLLELRIPHDYEEIPGLGHDLLPYYQHAGLAGFRFPFAASG